VRNKRTLLACVTLCLPCRRTADTAAVYRSYKISFTQHQYNIVLFLQRATNVRCHAVSAYTFHSVAVPPMRRKDALSIDFRPSVCPSVRRVHMGLPLLIFRHRKFCCPVAQKCQNCQETALPRNRPDPKKTISAVRSDN